MAPLHALAYARHNRERFLAELKDFVRFPSISAQPKHADDVKKCAGWLAAHLRGVGMEHVKVIPTRGHPIVYASWRHAPARLTVLIYGHYDVQPPDPLQEWQSPPFSPTVRGQDLYGRGACDDKGQLFAHIKSIESYLQGTRELPVNVECLFEGEEEIGSPSFRAFVTRNKPRLKARVTVMSDTRMLAPDRPAISYAQRGMLGLELEVRGPQHDLHSGNFGGSVHNPIQVLAEIVARLHDSHGRVAIPGFYDKVRQWSDHERAYMSRVGPSDAQIVRDAQMEQGWGELGYSQYERTTIRPALTLNGVTGGYQGTGVKGVIPARARVKLSFRLVPDQDPEDIDRLFRSHVARVAPPTVRCTVRTISRARPAIAKRNHPAMKAARFAYRKGFGSPPVFLRSGGTIPVVNTFQEILETPTVLMGFALPDDRIHAPNEKFHLPNFYKGIDTCIWYLTAVGAIESRLGKPMQQESTRRARS